jgi:pyrroloquinoline quinone biosynthesis protein E
VPASSPPPFVGLLAELTHRCPLACPYCSNPLELVSRSAELSTDTWREVFRQAAAAGALHVHLSGGEPAARKDLVELVASAHDAGLYTNLITSGIGLPRARVEALVEAGLDHLQLSVQSTETERAVAIGGRAGALDRKREVARDAVAAGLPLTLNAVLHRMNADEVDALVSLADAWGAQRLELAHVQLMGWAWKNRDALVPTDDEVASVSESVAHLREVEARAHRGRPLVIDYVRADTHAERPKACMGGWGALFIVVAPDGTVLPCHGAAALPIRFPRVPESTLEEAWQSTPFARFRSQKALEEPCRSCDEYEQDRGGCRCQAFLATADLRGADPACALSPAHDRLVELRRPSPAAQARARGRVGRRRGR